jgi:hypothetical protein
LDETCAEVRVGRGGSHRKKRFVFSDTTFGQSQPMGSTTTHAERAALLRKIRFAVADSWPQSPGKETIVRVLDDMIREETSAS